VKRPPRFCVPVSIALFSALVPAAALADGPRAGYAEPPPGSRPAIAVDSPDPDRDDGAKKDGVRAESSPVRLSVGPVARTDGDAFHTGLGAAADFGRGPAGVRLSAAWVQVGYDDPLAQYTGELTLSFGERWRIVPVVGAGGGLARTYRVDGDGNRTGGGSNLGVGVIRGALEYRLPLGDTDARAGLAATLTVPAARASNAPDLPPWALFAATVGIGF
jgi:hypothetical protein